LRDLNWLFNATQHEDAMFKDHPAIQQSVLNFGIPALAGRPSSALRMRGVEESLRRSIVEFEPRLNPESVRVRAESGGDGQSSHNVVSFRIEAQLWAQPYPLALLLRTELDLESGASRVLETSGG
jgi:type VI secretion system protein ImpF